MRLPINSGYPGRPADDFRTDICEPDAAGFAAGDYEPDVLYVVSGTNPARESLVCEPLIGALMACRAPS
jgi:hypothetical protein